MDKKWQVLVNGMLWVEKLTRAGAEKVASDLRNMGRTNVSVAFRIIEKGAI